MVGLQCGGHGIGLRAIFEQDEDRAGVVAGLGKGLGLGHRQEDRALVVAGCIGGINAADGEDLLIDAAV